MAGARRQRLPATRNSITHKVEIQDGRGNTWEVYITVGLYENGRPGELFIKTGKWGGTVNGLLDTIGIQTSLLLQYGVPLDKLTGKLEGLLFEPSGVTNNPKIPTCTSIVDYIFTWFQLTFEANVS